MKYKRFRITFDLLKELFETGKKFPAWNCFVPQGFPSDSKLVNVQHGWPNVIELLIESPSFDEVEQGKEIPFLDVLVEVQ